MMKRLLLVLLLTAACFAQEIRRPTTDANATSSGICTGGNLSSGSAVPNAYDAGTPPTTTSGSFGVGSLGATKFAAKLFSGWASASGSYSALTINVNFNCSNTYNQVDGKCGVEYSTNSGTSWTTLYNTNFTDTAQFTATATIPAGTTLSQVQVRICTMAAVDADTTATTQNVGIWDIWTSGTLGSSRRRNIIQSR